MRIKLGKDIRCAFAVFLSLIIAMQLEVNRIILLVLICLNLFLIGNSIRKKAQNSTLENIKKHCKYALIVLVLFMVIQIPVVGLGFRNMIIDIEILACVYIGIICGSISMSFYDSFEAILKGILLFEIAFSVYYILAVILHGLPEGRDSAMGIVSSNFCSAVLYLNYPIILYYLFGKSDNRRRNKLFDVSCYLAIVLSLIVIVSSGSRTAIGIIAVMAFQMFFYKQKKMKNRFKVLGILVVAVIGLLVAYRVNQSIQLLMDRALNVFEGKKTLDTNVRMLVWDAGIQQFKQGNVFFGLGTSIVDKFNISAHNLLYEVLMCSGYIGTVLFILVICPIIVLLFRNQKYEQKFFTVMLLFSSVITAFVQPFFSSSYVCGIMIWIALFALTADAERRL